MTAMTVVPGEEELGDQKRCPRCGEWWPRHDETFWRRQRDGSWFGWCRACAIEYSTERKRMARIADRVA